MSLNPFLLPILYDFHALQNFEELSELFIAGHLMIGHFTGFGKLVDEKILPQVFGTAKLSKKFRRENPPYKEADFNEIDHVIAKKDGKPDLLSLKSSKWSIQLTMAVQINKSFGSIIRNHGKEFDNIIVGVLYGRKDGLTDKYDILRGINRGAKHDVEDLIKRVHVIAGRDFWSWINSGQKDTQEWILQGVLKAINDEKLREECKQLMCAFNQKIMESYTKFNGKDGKTDWMALLKEING